MTDQNNLARDLSREIRSDDPLEELARIVSGGIDFDAERKRRMTAGNGEAHKAEQQAKQQTVDDMAYDLESELMRELGTERYEPPADEIPDDQLEKMTEELSESLSDELEDIAEFGQFDHPVRNRSAQAEMKSAAMPSAAEENAASDEIAESAEIDEISLEDQLMAELETVEKVQDQAEVQAEARQPDAKPAQTVRNTTAQIATAPTLNRRDTSFGNLPPRKTVEKLAEQPSETVEEPREDTRPPQDIAPETASSVPASPVTAEKSQLPHDASDEEPAQEQDVPDVDFAAAFSKEVLEEPANTRAAAKEEARPLQPESSRQPDGQSQSVAAKGAGRTERQSTPDSVSTGEASESVSTSDDRPVLRGGSDRLAPQDARSAFAKAEEDMSAAFEAELAQLGVVAAEAARQQQAPAKAERIEAPVTPIPPQAELDAEFAKAFAKELDLGDEIPAGSDASEKYRQERPAARIATPISDLPDPDDEPVNWGGKTAQDELPEFDMPDDYVGDHAEFDAEFAMDDDEFDLRSDVDDFETEQYSADEAAGKKRSSGYKLAAAAIVVALIAGLAAFAYTHFSGSVTGAVPVIVRADPEPVKIKPTDPGGTTIANQDKAAYERVTGDFATSTRQETLVKSTETPVNVLERTEGLQSGSQAGTDMNSGLAANPNEGKEEDRLAPGSIGSQAPSGPVLEPRRVKTLTVMPDGTIVAPAPEPVLASADTAVDSNSIGGAHSTGEIAVPLSRPESLDASTGAAQSQSDAAAPIPLAPATTQSVRMNSPIPGEVSSAAAFASDTAAAAPDSGNSGSSVTSSVEQPVNTASLSANTTDTVRTATSAGSWAVQISSQRSAEEAQATYQKMRDKYSNIIGSRQISIQRAEVEGKGTFFRVRVMAQTRQEAIDICTGLKSAGGSCFVTQ